ncbi:MAG: phage shock protein A [Desulfobacteraceae bacterium IS3]|nr:MAG: phage shock protein A [Desulfobacteraceae bacterium IS3]
MGIFTRFREIISSNINAMLDSAEDPEKLIKLIIREMEDTLVEIKASCAGAMAGVKKVRRQSDEVRSREKYWEDRAKLAVSKGRDDLAREALMEKRRYSQKAEALEKEMREHSDLVDQYQNDIRQLEDKLAGVREKQRILIQRHIHATKKKQAQEEIRRADTSQAIFRVDALENRIEQMEAEADLVNFGKKARLEEKFDRLTLDDEIEKELQALKSPLVQKDEKSAADAR